MSKRDPAGEYATPSVQQTGARSPKKLFAALAIGVLLSMLLVIGCWYGLRYLFLGRWTLPTTADFAAVAQRQQCVAQAICDYRADHGMLPQMLDDLVPTYLDRVPEGMGHALDGQRLSVHAGVPHTYVYYDFQPGQEG